MSGDQDSRQDRNGGGVPVDPLRPRRSGEGMTSLLQHLRDHLKKRDLDHKRDDEPAPRS